MQLILLIVMGTLLAPSLGSRPRPVLPSVAHSRTVLAMCDLRVVVFACRVDRIGSLHDLPTEIVLDHRVLNRSACLAARSGVCREGVRSDSRSAIAALRPEV